MQSFIRAAKYSELTKTIGSHYHDTHQILFVVNGSAEISVNREIFRLSRGDIIFISRMESHSINSAGENYSRYEIRISPDILNSTAKDFHLYSILLNRPKGFNRVIKLPPEEAADLFNRITKEYNSDNTYRDEMLSLLLEMLFIIIYRHHPDVFEITNLPVFETVRKIQQEFENNISRAYSLTELAAEYHINKYYLSHIFKTVTGYSVIEYLKALRMAKAKTLLTKTALNITEIIKICGFSDSSNFSREFKALTGLSPRDFRKKHSTGFLSAPV